MDAVPRVGVDERPFFEYLDARLAAGGFSTEDALATFLPLVRQVRAAHDAGLVAPLDDVQRLVVRRAKLVFPDSLRQPIRNRPEAVDRLSQSLRGEFEIVGETERTFGVSEGRERTRRLDIGIRGEPLDRPVFLPGYVAWEHEVGHHDPITDAFSLGLILASLACRLDLRDPAALEQFVTHRRNLFAIRPELHPVLAKVICRLTELDRHRRIQDLETLERSLVNYREQTADLDLDLARIPGFKNKDLRTREQVILGRLRERLFEMSRRNRLLHFQTTLQSVNLTYASVPLSFDIHNIRPDQILVWNQELQRRVARGDSLPLNKYLNFSEAIYLPVALDRLLAESRRDAAEFGFVQLRLVLCFLHWADLKSTPVDHYDSPLVLLPVRLVKRKGVRDTYALEPLSDTAEVNPVIRHVFQQNHGIELPESIDLTVGSLDEFYDYLVQRVAASEPGVHLEKIERPRIEIVHEKARRRLDQYRRAARMAGRGVRSYADLDYSYDPANFQPLGIQIFHSRLRHRPTRLERMIRATSPAAASTPSASQASESKVRESSASERREPDQTGPVDPAAQSPQAVVEECRMARLLPGGEPNPYVWTFDLGNVTLSNFRYRKMSLVRDYDALLSTPQANPAFEATFSLTEGSRTQPQVAEPRLEDRYDIVACDPTQATAIAASRTGSSYIIQGPPGTGKSQTITNLIADYAARGMRVLFVCEKRAAIDVVYARLRHRNLGPLCCLIHDSQADKKSFVMDLKQTYESFVTNTLDPDSGRSDVLRRMRTELRGLQKFDQAMRAESEQTGLSVRRLLDRCLRLSGARPELDVVQRERLPSYGGWWTHREAIERFNEALLEFQTDGILAHHPLRMLSPRLIDAARPVEAITRALKIVREAVAASRKALARSGMPESDWETPAQARQLVQFAREVAPVARGAASLNLLKPTVLHDDFEMAVEELARLHDACAAAQQASQGWRKRIPERDLGAAMAQAKALEGKLLLFLRPSWWHLNYLLRKSYDFSSHVVCPSWTQILEWLKNEYHAVAELEQHKTRMCHRFGLRGNVEILAKQIMEIRHRVESLPDGLTRAHAAWMKSPTATQTIEALELADTPLQSLESSGSSFLEDFAECSWPGLDQTLEDIASSLDDVPDFLHCLKQLAGVPSEVASALRHFSLTAEQLEAAIADHTLEMALKSDRTVHQFSSASRDRHADRLAELYPKWLEANSNEVLGRAQQTFVESHRMSQANTRSGAAASTGVAARETERRKRFARGCRELEHEFGKTMRYRAIRDLVSDETGEVIRLLKPVWLMSPLSVADTLPLNSEQFDVVIFDEASQITLEESVPPLFRARQTIVVGDEQQLPPTDFFAAKRIPDDERSDQEPVGAERGGAERGGAERGGKETEEREAGPTTADLESDSFLNHAARNLPSWMLGWHYRSRSESLISFSNWRFYDGRLLTAPEERLPSPDQAPIEADAPEDGAEGAAEVLRRPLSFHFVRGGVYEQRRNRGEAEYIANLVRGLLNSDRQQTIGIVAFSEAQQSQIEEALDALAEEDESFRERLEAEWEREDDGQFVGLLLKNLENMQGDERDIVILSICYGPGPDGRMLMHFGPINKSGGERRLNVAFSRAKRHMVVVSSIRADAIRNDYNDGANCLKNYLRYAEAVSRGDAAMAERVLKTLTRYTRRADGSVPSDDALVEPLAAALESRGYLVDRSVGQSHFRCDLALRRPGDHAYRLGILVDHAGYYAQTNILERDVLRPTLLRDFGWQVVVVLAKDWYRNPKETLEKILKLADGSPGCPKGFQSPSPGQRWADKNFHDGR